MFIDWTQDFDLWIKELRKKSHSDPGAQLTLDLVIVELSLLKDLKEQPMQDSKHICRVRSSMIFPLWRVGHPYVKNLAIRLIVWFPLTASNDHVVVVLAGNKAMNGGKFYDQIGQVCDKAIHEWLSENQEGHEKGEQGAEN